MTDDSPVISSLANGILSLSWNRPQKKNALTQEMYGLAADAFNAARDDRRVRVVLLSGGQDCFTAGNDLKDFQNNPRSDEESNVVRFLRQISTFNKPLVAAVNGPAVGVGTTMLLHCDMVVAASSAVFSLPFARLGLCPEGASSYLLPRIAGPRRAAELLMLGENFDAECALEWGIVNRVEEADQFLAAANVIAKQLASMPPASMRTTKQLLKASQAGEIAQTLTAELEHFGAMLESPEAAEAMQAFFEKRAPDFSRFE